MLKVVAVVVVWLVMCGVVQAQYVPIPNEQSGSECPNSIDQCSGFKIRTDINNKFSTLGANDCQWTPSGFQCTKINGAPIATGFASGLMVKNAIPIAQVPPTNGQCLQYQASSNTFIFSTCGGGGGSGGNASALTFGPTTLNNSSTAPAVGQCLANVGGAIAGTPCTATSGSQLIDYSLLPGCGSTPAEYYVMHVPSGACRANWPVISAGANWISAAMAIQSGSSPTPPALHGSTSAQNSNGNLQSLVVPMPAVSSTDIAVMFVQDFDNSTNIPTPGDWTFVNRHTRFAFGAEIQLAVFARAGSGLLSSYTVGTSGNFQLAAVAYTISGTNGSLTPDSLVFADGNSPTPTISALSGLAGSYDMVLGVDDLQLPGFTGPVGMTQDQYAFQPISNNTTQAGIWAGHLTLSNNTSSTAQTGIWQAPSATGPTCKLSCNGNSGQYVEEGF